MALRSMMVGFRGLVRMYFTWHRVHGQRKRSIGPGVIAQLVSDDFDHSETTLLSWDISDINFKSSKQGLQPRYPECPTPTGPRLPCVTSLLVQLSGPHFHLIQRHALIDTHKYYVWLKVVIVCFLYYMQVRAYLF